LADRGFGDVDLYDHIGKLGFDFVIRFRGCTFVTAPDGRCAPASQWVPLGGRARRILNARVTGQQYEVAAFVAVKKAKMKDSWILASSLTYAADRIVALYARRFTCEENFRDEKDPRFGMGSRLAQVRDAARRDRLCFIHDASGSTKMNGPKLPRHVGRTADLAASFQTREQQEEVQHAALRSKRLDDGSGVHALARD
jgi:Transposase DDE domain